MPDHIAQASRSSSGQPVRTKPWPTWPRADERTEALLLEVLRSSRWAITGEYNGTETFGRRAESEFARLNSARYCVTTCNGSAALVAALHALEVRPGQEVLVPGLTWVACASAVLRVGAIPILVDIDPETLCMSPNAARSAITSDTAAIILVHASCKVADLPAFMQLSSEFKIPLIEDCSQAHGATWCQRPVGTFGAIGVFSLQNSKVLTCGEGGAAITYDERLYGRLEQVRADGRRYRRGETKLGDLELEEVGTVQGYNMCMSEFQAAVLLGQMPYLHSGNVLRRQRVRYLDSILEDVDGVDPIRHDDPREEATYYYYCVKIDRRAFNNLPLRTIQDMVSDEIGLQIDLLEAPMNAHRLYQPLNSEWVYLAKDLRAALNPARFSLPNAQMAAESILALPHKVLLASEEDLDDVPRALKKVQARSQTLRSNE